MRPARLVACEGAPEAAAFGSPISLECVVCGQPAFRPLAWEGAWQWMCCSACGFVRIADAFDVGSAAAVQTDDMARSYVAGYERKFASKMRRSRRRLARLVRLMPGRAFLDVGSNYGFMVEAARRAGLDGIGVEVNPVLAAAARNRFPDCRFVASSLEEARLDRRFDGVYCSEVIEHVPDPRLFLRHIAGLANPGGWLFLTTPDIAEYRRRRYENMGAPDHKLYFSRATLSRLLAEEGFPEQKFLFSFRKGLKVLARRTHERPAPFAPAAGPW